MLVFAWISQPSCLNATAFGSIIICMGKSYYLITFVAIASRGTLKIVQWYH